MMIVNSVDHFAIAIDAIKGGAKVNQNVSVYAHEKCHLLKHLWQKEKDYLYSFGKGVIESLVFPFQHRFSLFSFCIAFVLLL
jgi:hypothetical protein